jgi:hypothetical protein
MTEATEQQLRDEAMRRLICLSPSNTRMFDGNGYVVAALAEALAEDKWQPPVDVIYECVQAASHGINGVFVDRLRDELDKRGMEVGPKRMPLTEEQVKAMALAAVRSQQVICPMVSINIAIEAIRLATGDAK